MQIFGTAYVRRSANGLKTRASSSGASSSSLPLPSFYV